MVAATAEYRQGKATEDRQFVPNGRQIEDARLSKIGQQRNRSRSLLNQRHGRKSALELESNPADPVLINAEEVSKMLSQCANGICGKPFLRLREGKLFLVETDRINKPGEAAPPPFVRARQQQRLVEHYWLCDDCAKEWTLVYDRERGVALAPLRRVVVSVAIQAAAQSGAA